MKRLILLLLSPAIFAEQFQTKDPNNEPFLPIHPVYPYSPKLIKRGTERELISQSTPEYVPKTDTKDSYSTGYSNNYQRDPYYDTNYNPYLKNTSPSPAYSSYYSGDSYAAYANSPYVPYNPYAAPYAVSPASYPDYYYQLPYYYPNYFNHALFSPPPPPPTTASSSEADYHETPQDSEAETEDKQDKDKKSKKPKEDETNQDAPTSQFVDGRNYISGNSRDLDVQSSTYKVASPYNQLEQDVQVKNLPIPLPKTTYRVVSVAGQPVGPDYPLPASYVKTQQIEQLRSQTHTKLLAQPDQSYDGNKDTLSGISDGSYQDANQDAYNLNTQSYVSLPSVRINTGVTHVINPDGTAKGNGERANPRSPSSPRASDKNAAKYLNVLYVRNSSPTSLDHSQATYILPGSRNKDHDRVIDSQDQTDEYDGYGAPQNYGGTLSRSGDKQEQNHENYQASFYRNKDYRNFTSGSQTPRAYSYQYSAYESNQAPAQQPQQDKINTDDGNFGAKQYNKG